MVYDEKIGYIHISTKGKRYLVFFFSILYLLLLKMTEVEPEILFCTISFVD
jgi:hypothetical protein